MDKYCTFIMLSSWEFWIQGEYNFFRDLYCISLRRIICSCTQNKKYYTAMKTNASIETTGN